MPPPPPDSVAAPDAPDDFGPPAFDPEVGGPTWAEVIWVGFRPLKCMATSLHVNSSENGQVDTQICKLGRKSK